MKNFKRHIVLWTLIVLCNSLIGQTMLPVQMNETEQMAYKHQKLQNHQHTDIFARFVSIDDTLFNRSFELRYQKNNLFARIYPTFYLAYGLGNRQHFLSSNTLGFQSDIIYTQKKHIFSAHIGSNFHLGLPPRYVQEFTQERSIVPGLFSKSTTDNWGMGINPDIHFQYQSPWLLSIETGLGKQHIGNGYRSLILSENSPAYPYAGIRTKFEQVNYQFRWMVLENHNQQAWINPENEKYAVMHYLSWNIGKHIGLGLFEGIIWTNGKNRNSFEAQYLNPFIFFRPVEFSVGSSDNALMGINLHYNINKKIQLYGQFILDDMIVSQMINDAKYRLGILSENEKHGWFANKYGGQIGVQCFDALGVKNLYLQTEINAIRPNTYAHNNVEQAYTHYYHALAHPLGANFIESFSRISYRWRQWNFTTHIMYAEKGLSNAGNNMGENIFYPVTDASAGAWIPSSSYGNVILQGNRQRILYADIDVAWSPAQTRHKLQLFAQLFFRQSQTETNHTKDVGFFIGGRTHLSQINAW